jgi:hypothetical protein
VKGSSCWLITVALFVAPSPIYAEQSVVLKKGPSLVGNVTIDGNDVVVQIADGKVRVPMSDVVSIASVNTGREQQARQLLFTALEARLMNGAGKEVVGLLAEAKKLAPDEPSVAFWYANTLLEAGFGKAAGETFDAKREAIMKAYPGMAEQLAARIKSRLDLEKLPADLVQRIDVLNKSAVQQSPTAEKRQLFAVFRVIDSQKNPIGRTSFRLETRGEEENLENYDDGYYLLTFSRNRYNRDEPCRIEVSESGLEAKEFQFSASTNRVAKIGDFVVKRYDEKAKKTFRVRVVGPSGEPVSDAKVTLQTPSRSGPPIDISSTTTGLDGTVEMQVFPMKYYYRASAEGYTSQGGNLDVKAGGAESDVKEIKLYRAIQASVRFAWVATGSPDGNKTSGESKVQASGAVASPVRYGNEAPIWVRATQPKDRLMLQFSGVMYGGPNQFGGDSWLGAIEADAAKTGSDRNGKAAEKFDAVDLNKIDEHKAKASVRNAGDPSGENPGGMTLPAEIGKVYVGKLQSRDMRTGRPLVVAFKAVVESLSGDRAAEKDQ